MKRNHVLGRPFVAALIFSGVLTGCTTPTRAPSSYEANFDAMLARIRKALPTLTKDSCAGELDAAYDGFNNYKLSVSELEAVTADERQYSQDLLELRIQARKELKRLYDQDPNVPADCVHGFRKLIMALRFSDEFIVEWDLRRKGQLKPPPKGLLYGSAPDLIVNKDYGPFNRDTDLQSGDLLMSRGTAYTSAAIARMADEDGQFSHVALVYVDPNSPVHQKWVIEAHIEIGVLARPIEQYYTDDNMRVVVLRANDPSIPKDLPGRAAAEMFQRARKATKSGKNIPYNFTLDLSVMNALFCSQVPYAAYRDANQGVPDMPLFMSTFTPKNHDFLDRLGVHVTKSFVPIDLEVDARFDMVAEWRNISEIQDTRMNDAMLDAFYRWSNDLGYHFWDSAHADFTKYFIYDVRHTPWIGRILQSRFPLNMTRTTLGTIIMFDDMMTALFTALQKKNNAVMQAQGYSMTPVEMAAALEDIRMADETAYVVFAKWQKAYNEWQAANTPRKAVSPPPPRQPAAPIFHKIFRPG